MTTVDVVDVVGVDSVVAGHVPVAITVIIVALIVVVVAFIVANNAVKD
jgi:hypothetical protein